MTRSDELRALARRFVESLPDDFDEALLTGSVSRCEADELSDVEMLLVARDTPPRPSALGTEMWQEDFVLRIVFALNRAWEPSWKRLRQLVAPRELVLDTLLLAPELPRVVLARERTARLLEELA